MEKLTKEEVLHVARLARLKPNEEEIEKYRVELKQILDEIAKIKDVEVPGEDFLISPTTNKCVLREDNPKEGLPKEEVLKNAPSCFDSFIEVRGVLK